MADDDVVEVPPCDECESDHGRFWCDKCNVVLCENCGGPEGKHKKHPVGTIGASDDPYNYGGDEGAHGGGESGDPGVITEYISEEQAYHLVEMMECNSHIACRKLFKPMARNALQSVLRTRREPSAVTTASFGSDEPVRLSPEQWAAFANFSYVVIDDFIPQAVAFAARDQTLQLTEQGLLTAYKNPMDVGRDDSVRSDLRAFIDGTASETIVKGGPLEILVSRLDQLNEALHEGITLTGEKHEYQLAYYGCEGQHYGKHRDAFPNDGSKHMTGQVGRRVTCTLYMNDYDDRNGGKLRIFVPTPGFDGEEVVEVAPVAGRAVLFLSGAMDHEVLPSFAPRCAIAAWYS